jgi:peptidoglycan-N-acetylglucosamine deacetylase
MMRHRRVATGLLLFSALTFVLLIGSGGQNADRTTWHAVRQVGAQGRGGGEPLDGEHERLTAASSPAQGSTPSSPGGQDTGASPSAPSQAPTGVDLARKMTGDDTVTLTFDDGPSTFTPQFLAMLREHNVKATFCLVGVNVRAHHDLVQQIVREGHTLCNHTWRHDLKLGKRSPDEIRADLQSTNDEIRRAVPDASIKYFRHPGGNFTPEAVAIAKELGMASVGWDVDPRDWDLTKYSDSPGMTNHIVNVVRNRTRPGSIVLSHDAGGDRSCTMSAYRTLLPDLKSRFKLAALPA